MKVVRRSVFETNSSSSHSICISQIQEDEFDFLFPEMQEDGVLTVELGQYGWGEAVLTTPYKKLCYVLTMFVEYSSRKWTNDCTERLEKLTSLKEYDEVVELLNNNVKGFKELVIDLSSISDCYIDHESVRGLNDLYNILFNTRYKILIDNDSYYHYQYIYDNPDFKCL